MAIKIVTDSTCDLPESVIAKYDITVIPMYINIGGRSLRDGLEISREEFYRQLPGHDPPPTTATPGQDVFIHSYQQLADRGATEILSLHISNRLSSLVNIARLAAQEVESVPVTVIDAQQLSLGTGFLVETAALAAVEGRPKDEIINLLEEQIKRTYVFAALDTLEFLRRSGRLNGVMAGIGSLLKVKPILHMHAGEPTSQRVRTGERALAYLVEKMHQLEPFERVALVHTDAPERAESLRQSVLSLLPEEEILSVDITPVIGAHIGPGAAGFAVIVSR
jgi:DegV family protein with EDD domain